MSSDDNGVISFISNAFGDEVIYDVNRNAFDREGAAAVFQRQFGSRLKRQDTLYIVVGTDSGLLANWILQDDLPEGSRYLFIEPGSLQASIEQRLTALEESPRVRLQGPDNWMECAQDFQFQDYAYLGRIEVIQSIGAADAYLTDYRNIHWEIQTQTKEFTWQVEFQLGSQAFVKRQIENIADNRDSALCVKDAFAGQTAVLLGGGPSLDELIPWVKQHREQITVIAVSRICRRLLQAELQPDIVVSIDPHPVSFDVSKEMLRFDNNTLLIHSFHVTPLLLAQWAGPTLFFGERLPWKDKSNPDNLATQGPTVTNTALSLAVQMGFDQVVLGGVDLCYSREGHTHASGSNERNAGPMLGNVGIQVETNGGWLADTRHSFASAVEIMGNQAKAALESDCQVINPAAGAARIPNVEHITLDNIQVPDTATSASSILEKHLPENSSEKRRKHYNDMLKAVARANGRLRAIQKLADEALECNAGLFGRNGKTADFKYKLRMDKIERKLDREYKDLSPLVKSFGSRSFLRLVRPDKDREWSDEDIEKWGEAYYKIYHRSADVLLDLLDDARQRISARLSEEQASPDFNTLTQQWNDDTTPGRALVWQQQHPDATLEASQQRSLDALAAVFEQVMNETDTEQARWCADNYTLSPVRSKLSILFQHHETDELIRTAAELEKMDSTEAQQLCALAQGYLAELAEDLPAAINAYQVLVDNAAQHVEENDGQLPNTPELEDALRRMSGIALGEQDDEGALMLMGILNSISPAYSTQYAELLKLTGDLEGAVDVYTRYLEKAPNDFGAMLKLGKIFQLAGAKESATWAYRYVLEKNPGNQAAQTLLNELSEIA